MCDFCKREEDGDVGPKRRMIDEQLNMGEFGEMDISLSLFSPDEKGPLRDLTISLVMTGKEIYRDVKVNYCPMCGRKLGGEQENV